MTPNSFSDPKKFLESKMLKETLERFKDRHDLIFDFGFESTAPMNQAVNEMEERERFDIFFDAIKDIDLNDRFISFDTYRPSSFQYFEEQFKSRYHNQGFLFNDVSGVIDSELISFLKNKKNDDSFFYLYSATHIPSREKVLNHMNFIKNGNALIDTQKKFKEAYKIFCEIGFKDKIVLDPGFGFSKSFEQNWELINHFPALISCVPDASWLVGVSKKSFLRKSLPDALDPFLESEKLHEEIIKNIIEQKLGHIIFRVHDFDIVKRARS